jgi:hypothetical protein
VYAVSKLSVEDAAAALGVNQAARGCSIMGPAATVRVSLAWRRCRCAVAYAA